MKSSLPIGGQKDLKAIQNSSQIEFLDKQDYMDQPKPLLSAAERSFTQMIKKIIKCRQLKVLDAILTNFQDQYCQQYENFNQLTQSLLQKSAIKTHHLTLAATAAEKSSVLGVNQFLKFVNVNIQIEKKRKDIANQVEKKRKQSKKTIPLQQQKQDEAKQQQKKSQCKPWIDLVLLLTNLIVLILLSANFTINNSQAFQKLQEKVEYLTITYKQFEEKGTIKFIKQPLTNVTLQELALKVETMSRTHSALFESFYNSGISEVLQQAKAISLTIKICQIILVSITVIGIIIKLPQRIRKYFKSRRNSIIMPINPGQQADERKNDQLQSADSLSKGDQKLNQLTGKKREMIIDMQNIE